MNQRHVTSHIKISTVSGIANVTFAVIFGTFMLMSWVIGGSAEVGLVKDGYYFVRMNGNSPLHEVSEPLYEVNLWLARLSLGTTLVAVPLSSYVRRKNDGPKWWLKVSK